MPFAARILLAAGVVATTGARPASTTPRRVTIEAHDYAYVIPSTVPPGPTVFLFTNRGRVLHEVQFFRFNPNVGETAARRYLASGNVPDSVADANGGVLLAGPGQTTREALYVELHAGERYALMCEMRDSTGKPPHAMLGMFALLTVH